MKKVEKATPDQSAPLVRGKYAHLLEVGSNVALLDPDVVDHFPDSVSVNNALRAFLAFGKEFESVIAPESRLRKRPAPAKRNNVFDPRSGRTDGKALAAK